MYISDYDASLSYHKELHKIEPTDKFDYDLTIFNLCNLIFLIFAPALYICRRWFGHRNEILPATVKAVQSSVWNISFSKSILSAKCNHGSLLTWEIVLVWVADQN